MEACGLMRQGIVEQHQAEGESLQFASGYLESLEAAYESSED
jgi:hypothetical protein